MSADFDGVIHETPDLGPLAAALAKAQSAFAPVTRSKTVKVTTKTGGSYTFSYAPLDTVLDAVRKPLADNGLALVQLLDGQALVTLLIHESGAQLEGRTPIPGSNDVQGYGSAITYLRRYAIQALLGIAAEDDDDGNRAAGNHAAPARAPRDEPQTADDGGLIGIAEIGKPPADFELRQTPEGHALAFRLVQGRRGIKVVAHGALAEALAAVRSDVVGKRVTAYGQIDDETYRPRGATKDVTYQVLALERIATPDFVLPAPDAAPEQPPAAAEPEPMFSEDEEAAIDAALGVAS